MLRFFDQPAKSDIRTHDNIRKIATGQGNDYTAGCLLDDNYFNKHYKIIAINYINNKDLMLIQKQYNKSVLLEI